MRHLTRSEFTGLITLLAIITVLATWTALGSRHTAAPDLRGAPSVVLSTPGRADDVPSGAPTPGTPDARRELALGPRSPGAANAAPSTTSGAPGATTPTSTHGAPSVPTEVLIHVAGAVKRPGVYHLGWGARNEDALKAAGEWTDELRPANIVWGGSDGH